MRVIKSRAELWTEMFDLEDLGVFGDDVYCVTHYKPSQPYRRGSYTKIVYRIGTEQRQGFRHQHVRVKHEKEIWDKWHRTVRYRQIKRQLNNLSRNLGL